MRRDSQTGLLTNSFSLHACPKRSTASCRTPPWASPPGCASTALQCTRASRVGCGASHQRGFTLCSLWHLLGSQGYARTASQNKLYKHKPSRFFSSVTLQKDQAPQYGKRRQYSPVAWTAYPSSEALHSQILHNAADIGASE